MRKKQVSSNESDLSSPRVDLSKRRQQDPDLKLDHKYYDQVYDEQRQLYLDQKFDKKALEAFHCLCQVCQKCSERKQDKMPPESKKKKNRKVQSTQDNDKNSDYAFILKRLVGPPRQPKSLKILIPDTVIFSDGEPKAIIYSQKIYMKQDRKNNNLQIKSIRQKEKLSLGQIRLQLNTRRKKQKELIDHFINVELQKVSSKLIPMESEILKTQSSQNQKQISKKSIPKRGRSAAKSGEQIQQENLELYFERNTREAVLCKFYDDSKENKSFSYILNEIEFLNLMMKRKNDEIWRTIQYIQNFIRPKKNPFEIINIKFKRSKMKDCLLFNRSVIESRILNGDILKTFQEYISSEEEQEFEFNLLRRNPFEYLRYITYKIVNFILVFDGCLIESGIFQFLKNDLNEYEFINANEIEFRKERITYLTTDEYFRKLESQAQDKLKMSPEMESKYCHLQKGKKIQDLTDHMEIVYKAQKQAVGMDIDYFDVVEDETSNLVYQKLHPNATHSFNEIMQSEKIYNNMRQKLLGFGKRKLYNDSGFSKMFDQFFYNPSKKQFHSNTNTPISTTILTRKDILGQSFSNSFATDNMRNYLKSQMTNSRDTPINKTKYIRSAKHRNDVGVLNRFNTEKKFSIEKFEIQRRQLKSEHNQRRHVRQDSSLETTPDNNILHQTPKMKIKKNSLPYYLMQTKT